MGAPPVLRRLARRVAAILAGVLLALLSAELLLRAVLFLPGEGPARRFAGVRQPHFFANNETDEYWKLQCRFLPPSERQEASNADPIIGWTWKVEPKTFRVLEKPPRDGRRLVVLYGDSFAQCNTPEDQCFQAVIEQSDLDDRFRMLNLGVGGYGLDQIYLLIRETIDSLREEDPIIAIGILVDNDLDRSLLSIRGLPKPRLVLRDGELVPTEPVVTDPDEFLERHPVGIASYLVRLIAHEARALPYSLREPWMGPQPDVAEAKRLNEAILRAIHAELAARGIEHFFYVFNGLYTMTPEGQEDWQERLIRDVGREEGVPVIATRPYLLAAAGGDLVRASSYFGGGPGLEGHFNELGNRIAFLGLRQGFLGEYDREDFAAAIELGASAGASPPVDRVTSYDDLLGLPAEVCETGSGQGIRWARDNSGDRRAGLPTWAFALRPGNGTPLSVRWSLPPGRWRLRGTLQFHPEPEETERCGVMHVGIVGPPGESFVASVTDRGPPVDVDLAFEGSREVEVRVRSAAGYTGGECRDWIVLRHACWRKE